MVKLKKNRQTFVVPHDYSVTSDPNPSNGFQYQPPDNTGTILGIIGGILTTVGDGLATIGAVIQLNQDVQSDYVSQKDEFIKDQETEKMQEQIEDLTKKIERLEKLLNAK